MPNPIREHIIAVPAAKRCRRPGCLRDAEIRGLCRSDYQTASVLVSEGVVSWEQLEQRGKVDEPRRSVKSWLLG